MSRAGVMAAVEATWHDASVVFDPHPPLIEESAWVMKAVISEMQFRHGYATSADSLPE